MKILDDQDAEFQRILIEIRSKNGLPFGIETNQVGKESDRKSSPMECNYTNSQFRASRRKGGKDEKRRSAGEAKRLPRFESESQIKVEQEAKIQQVTIPDQPSGRPALIQSTYATRAISN